MGRPEKTLMPFMALAGLMLLAGLWAGLARLGWRLPQPGTGLMVSHGALMVGGFLGTLIGLERVGSVKRWWAYGAPFFAALGGLASLAGLPAAAGKLLFLFASLSLVVIFVALVLRHGSAPLAMMALGAVLWAAGNGLWLLGHPYYRIVPWWVGFLVFTIAGERLDLSRVLRPSRFARAGFFAAHAVLSLGLSASLLAFDAGLRMAGIGLVGVAAWLLRYDLAWRTVSHPGLHRFMALCLLSGYLWLGIGGLLWIGFAHAFRAGPLYDAMLHSLFLGFVFSMIFAHAPIIFPAITGMAMPFQELFHVHLALLHLSLALRVGSGVVLWMPGQRWGGLLNALAIVVFLANNIRAVKRGHVAAAEAA